jgi:hypothetical protein
MTVPSMATFFFFLGTPLLTLPFSFLLRMPVLLHIYFRLVLGGTNDSLEESPLLFVLGLNFVVFATD